MARDDCCYLCNECPNSFPTLAELEKHLGEDHVAAKCDADHTPSASGEVQLDKKMDLEMTEIDEHIVDHSPTSSDDSIMSDQDENTSTNDIKPALFTGARIAGHSCRICGRAFTDRGQLNVHYTHTHRDKPQYECEHCQAVFCVKRELSTHLRIHSGGQPHKCNICGKEFGTRQLLKKHNMWHTGERSHVCQTCGKAFFQKGHLTQHLMIHKGGRPHRCTQCEKTFIFKFDLNRHMKIHAERGFSCSKCGKSFLKQGSWEEHFAKCKRTIGTPQSGSTRTSTPSSDISCQESPSLAPLSRRVSNASLQQDRAPSINPLRQIPSSPFQALTAMNENTDGDCSPTEAATAPITAPIFTNPFLLSQFGTDDQSAAQNLMSQYQNEQAKQQRLLVMNAAQRLFQNVANQQQQQQQQQPANLMCALCNMGFTNAAAYTLHISFSHLNQQRLPEETASAAELKLNVCQKSDEIHTLHSDTATSSSCASSPQKVSPISHVDVDSKFCDHCDNYRGVITDLEKQLQQANEDAERFRETIQRFNSFVGQLLSTQHQVAPAQTAFQRSLLEHDKIWTALH